MDARTEVDGPYYAHSLSHTATLAHTHGRRPNNDRTTDRERGSERPCDGSSSDAVAASTDLEIRAAAAETNDMYHQKVRLADGQTDPPFLRYK